MDGKLEEQINLKAGLNYSNSISYRMGSRSKLMNIPKLLLKLFKKARQPGFRHVREIFQIEHPTNSHGTFKWCSCRMRKKAPNMEMLLQLLQQRQEMRRVYTISNGCGRFHSKKVLSEIRTVWIPYFKDCLLRSFSGCPGKNQNVVCSIPVVEHPTEPTEFWANHFCLDWAL